MKVWRGKDEPDDKSGEADYMVEGELFTVPMPTFERAQYLDYLLCAAFLQGKQFAFRAVESHVKAALHAADVAHNLSDGGVNSQP